MSRFFKSAAFPILIVIVLAFFASKLISDQDQAKPATFSQFLGQLDRGEVRDVTLRTKDNSMEVRLNKTEKNKYTLGYPPAYAEVLVNNLRTAEAENKLEGFNVKPSRSNVIVSLLTYILPFIIFIGFWIFLMNQVQGGGSKVMSFGKSRAKRMSVDSPKITFRDVAGVDEAVEELHEIKEFLENPKKFQALGARIPKGVLLYGPPGTGKTLLARAVAGEAGVPFFSISGSDFVEMYVGVGAARVRELFRDARENGPAIVFIDEIDAVARKRRSSGGSEGSSEEQGQALNQLLTEMDGFSSDEGTIVIAATNRPDDLDQALLRPGRFDRAISVDRPNEADRIAILALHARGKPLAADIDTTAVARRAIGLTGADLETVTNEAALLAARAGRSDISQRELEDALTRILEAPERQRRLTMRDRSIGQQSLDAERVTFADVAGVGAALTELTEIRDFLVEPGRFAKIGARFPRGFLLVGPPGCGKTLLARAVAGEANAAFLSVAATEFTEVFVGEGSGRVRDLFARARALAPAIVFIDEIDAIGARRGSASQDGHREREQTLNQILVELDGFRQRDGVIVMAATNRPEILDPALVRAGRFDREITIELPDRAGRRDILELHVGTKRLASDVDLDAIAGITRGLSGADLANVMNEAALLGARRGEAEITMAALEAAVERATLGISRAHVLTDRERRVVAVHEAGHAVVARAVPEGRLPHMISIIPSGRSLGRAWLTDTHDRLVESRSGLIDHMAILLGGRCAEHLVFGEAGSNAVDDLAQVGRIAHHMVRELGMSDAIGPIGYPEDADVDGRVVSYSDDTARLIDAEVRRLIDEALARAEDVLQSSRDALERLAAALLETETLSAAEIEAIAGRRQPASAPS